MNTITMPPHLPVIYATTLFGANTLNFTSEQKTTVTRWADFHESHGRSRTITLEVHHPDSGKLVGHIYVTA